MTSARVSLRSEPEISIVIPFLDEEGSLEALHAKLSSVLGKLGRSYEILFIDDGSEDSGGRIADSLADKDPHVGVVHFRRNFGKAAALDAGFRRVQGRLIFTLDADLQDDPEEIPSFLEKLEEGYDVVSGWKKTRHDPIHKTLPSRIFNLTVRTVSGVKLSDFNCGFKLYRAEAVEELELYGELHRYIPVLVHSRGFRVTQIPVRHHPRRSGSSKYGLERMAKGFFDLLTVLLITRFRARPLHLFGGIGLAFAFAGLICLGYLSIGWFFGKYIGQRPLLFLGVLLMMVGAQLVSTGLLGEMISSSQVRQRPHYAVREERRPRSAGLPFVPTPPVPQPAERVS